MPDNPLPDQPPVYGGNYGTPPQPPAYGGEYTTPPAYGDAYGTAPPPPAYGTAPPPPAGYPPAQPANYQYPAQPANYQYPAQPAMPMAAPAPRRRRGMVQLVILGVVVLGIIAVAVLYSTGILSNVTAPDYPGATKSSLTSEGQNMANSLYEDNNADTSHVKVFYTSDTVSTVSDFYKSKLTTDGWTVNDQNTDPDASIVVYDKDSQETVVIAGPSSLHWVQNAPDDSTSILLLIGDKPSN